MLQVSHEIEKFAETIQAVRQLHESFPEDLHIARALVKTNLAVMRSQSMTEFFFEAHELKIMLDEARQINSVLVERHGYTKYEAKLDFFEGMFCADYLTNQQFNRMTFKYIGDGSELATARNQISMRNIMKDRL